MVSPLSLYKHANHLQIFNMTKYFIKTLTAFCVLTFIASCDRPECKNTNSVFDKYSPETKEYKEELVKQLKRIDNSKLSYWLDKYQEDDSVQYLHVFIQGEALCAKGIVTIKKWDDKLDGIRTSNGMGYSGAELSNLKIDIYQDSTKTEFIYNSVDAIVD